METGDFFMVDTNISGERGSMSNGTLYRNLIVNQHRYLINVYISNTYPGNFEMLSWSCLDKDGKAFSPNHYSIPDNQYFTIKTIGLGSFSLTKVASAPPTSLSTPIFSIRFNTPKKYLLDLKFYWVSNQSKS